MKFNFRLQKVLEQRKILENLAKAELSEAMVILNQSTDLLQHLVDEKKKARVKSFTTETNSVLMDELKTSILSQASRFQILQDIRIEKQKKVVEENEKVVESLREILKNKAIDYKIIEKVKSKKIEEFIRDLIKLEQKESDDVNVSRILMGNKK